MTKFSIITATMDRNDILNDSLINWTKYDSINEIIIVDWSSKSPFELKNIKDDRINIYRVNGEREWVLSHAFNLSASLANGDVLIKMDVDYILKADVTKIYLSKKSFIKGNGNAEMVNKNFNG